MTRKRAKRRSSSQSSKQTAKRKNLETLETFRNTFRIKGFGGKISPKPFIWRQHLMKFLIATLALVLFLFNNSFAQTNDSTEKAEAILAKAVEKLGGERYLQVKTVFSSGNFSVYRDGFPQITQTFVDVIVFPDRERTEFKTGGAKIVQTNTGDTGWIADASARVIKDQNEEQVESFKRGIRTSLDNLLRGGWRKENATLSFVGRRPATLGKRNNVVKLAYPSGFEIEFEFSDDGFPVKSIYKRNADGEEIREEDRYAQFIEVQGILAPFIVDHFQNGVQTSRINYQKIEFNKNIPDSIFQKPSDPKELKKDLKL
jgi:outer membrane lipoprotein-sorting protein